MKIETLAIHTANDPDPATGAVAPSIHLSTTYARRADGELVSGYSYSRSANPNRESLEKAAAELEGGAAGYAFSSGMAAIAAVLGLLQSGDHLLAPVDVYHGTRGLIRELVQRGIQADFVDMEDAGTLEAALQPNTRLVYIETPSNPMLRITDIAAAAALAHGAGALLAVDNTWPTPVFQRPLDLGADYVVHSSTKYFGGHSDVLGGIVVTREEGAFFRGRQELFGAVPSPFDCWLVRRGLMTLPLRIRAQTGSAARIAAYLENHPRVDRVHYPGLESHPGHETAAKQMAGFGAMLSFEVSGGERAAAAVCSNLRFFTQATSLGSVESLVEHRYRVEGPESRTPKNLLRVSVGLEHVDDLLEDLETALGGLLKTR